MEIDLKLDPIAQAVAKAQEKFHVVMEAQNKEKKQWIWVEEVIKTRQNVSKMKWR